MMLQDCAIAIDRIGVLAFIFQRHGCAERGLHIIMDEDRRMPAAFPCLLQALEWKPASLSIAELRANEIALRIDAIDDDVVEEIVCLAGSEDDLQHQDCRPALMQFIFDECR